MRSLDLKTGDILFHEPTNWIGEAIVKFTGGRFSHVGQVLITADGEVKVAEMAFPKSHEESLDSWWTEYRPIYVGRLLKPLSQLEANRLIAWWAGHLGDLYDIPLLLRLGYISLWQRVCWSSRWAWVRRLAKIQPATLGYVCSTAVATACKYAGIAVDETSGMTPADLANQEFLAPIEPLEYTPQT